MYQTNEVESCKICYFRTLSYLTTRPFYNYLISVYTIDLINPKSAKSEILNQNLIQPLRIILKGLNKNSVHLKLKSTIIFDDEN